MNNFLERLVKQERTILILLLIAILIFAGIYSIVYENKNIKKQPLNVFVQYDTKEIFEKQFNGKKKFNKYYKLNLLSSPDEADIIFSSDTDVMNKTRVWTVEGYSPLVVCLKSTSNLNNYLKTTTKSGFLTCKSSKKIKSYSSSDVDCDFKRIIDVVLEGGDWSDLGGEDIPIQIYVPEDERGKKLFYEFTLVTLNGGSYPKENLESIKKEAEKFLSSSNVIKTDVATKINKFGDEIQENSIFVLFEADLINRTNHNAEICVAYPTLTIEKKIYLQINNLELLDDIQKAFDSSGFESQPLTSQIHASGYRTKSSMDFSSSTIRFNLQNGFNAYNYN